jgi:hypothetical protein
MINQLMPALLLIPGFWLGWKLLTRFLHWLQQFPKHPVQLSPTQKTILWLAVGGLFSNTLIFLYQFFYSLVTMLIIPGWCYSQPDLMTRFGRISSCFQILPAILFFLIILAFVTKYFIPFITKQKTKINKFYMVLLLLTIVNFIFKVFQLLFNFLISPG